MSNTLEFESCARCKVVYDIMFDLHYIQGKVRPNMFGFYVENVRPNSSVVH